MRDDDRTVHVHLLNGLEIVRYDRSGKWYEESPGQRKRIGISTAVATALTPGATVFLGKMGGRTFDAKVRLRRGF